MDQIHRSLSFDNVMFSYFLGDANRHRLFCSDFEDQGTTSDKGILVLVKNYDQSQELFHRARQIIPGGVNSPVRSFRSVGLDPLFIDRGAGSHIFDVDGNDYIDYVMSYGPLLFGHAHPRVTKAIQLAAEKGTSFGASSPGEVQLAEKIVALFPSVDVVRLVNSGTEAVMSAVRTARGFTKRDKIIKFEGCYHGHSDGLLSSAGSGVATFDLPGSAGIPANLTRDTLTVPYNDFDLFREAIRAHESEIAAVLVEPVAANMGVVLPKPGFLELLRDESRRIGAVLIFDEVITGFRLAPGGAQEFLGIIPDMTCLGKIAGGGLPLAAYGGRAEIMSVVAPSGPVYQAGTLSGNPLAVAAGLALLQLIEETPSLYADLQAKADSLSAGLNEAASRSGIPHRINSIGSILTLFFADGDVTNYSEAKRSDTARYANYFKGMLDRGVMLAPSQFEAAFVSAVHSEDDLRETVELAAEVLSSH